MQQNLEQKEQPGLVFVMHLFMREKCKMPEKEFMEQVMRKHLGDVECFCHDEKVAGFAPQKYRVTFENGEMPPQLMVTEGIEAGEYHLDEITRSQMWDCPESEQILSECKYQVVATDMLAGGMEYRDRAENVRFFNIQGTKDMLIDSLGMSTLYLPDLQYHFHGMDPNWVVNHAYNILSYIYQNDCPFKSGDTVDGVENGALSMQVQWRCRYEDSLIQPSRPVLDICMGEFAAGGRG